MSETFDIAIVGLGAMGSAALYQLARRGLGVVGIDRFTPPHAQGSSHGETRITRRATGEGEAYVPLVARAHEIWRELEAETGRSLFNEVGSLIVATPGQNGTRPGQTGFIEATIDMARRHNVIHEILSADDIERRFVNFTPDAAEIGYFEPGGGYLSPERCLGAQLERAGQLGATLRLGQRVTALAATASGVSLTLENGTVLAADQAIVTAGAWAPRLLGPPFNRVLKPTRQVMHWFALIPGALPAWRQAPVFMWPHGQGENDFFYGFPSLDSASIKVADESHDPPCDPDLVDRKVREDDSLRLYSTHIAGRLAGVTPRPLRSATCLYTETADGGFLIDRHPLYEKVLVASPCSGHGFKHSAAIGESLAQWVSEGRSHIDLSPFALARLL